MNSDELHFIHFLLGELPSETMDENLAMAGVAVAKKLVQDLESALQLEGCKEEGPLGYVNTTKSQEEVDCQVYSHLAIDWVLAMENRNADFTFLVNESGPSIAHKRFVRGCCEMLGNVGYLTAKQIHHLTRIAVKYKRQTEEIGLPPASHW